MDEDIKEEIADFDDEMYYFFTKDGWHCEIDGETIPLAFVVNAIHSTLWDGEEDPYWEVACGVIPTSLVKPDDEEKNDLAGVAMYYGFIPVNINAINPDEKLPFEKDGSCWTFEDDDLLEKAAAIAKDRAQVVMGLIGFFLDAPYNRLGQSGWDVINEWLGKDDLHSWLVRQTNQGDELARKPKLQLPESGKALSDFITAHPWLNISTPGELRECILDNACPVERHGCRDFVRLEGSNWPKVVCNNCNNFDDPDDCGCDNATKPYCKLHPDAFEQWKTLNDGFD